MSMIKEFKEFAIRGNMIDMAVGIIIGAAFGKVVSSLVSDVLMPPVGLLLGGVDFSNLMITIKEGVGDFPPVAIKYGVFINAIIDFFIVAFSIFLVIRGINKFQKEKAAESPKPSEQEKLLTEIRDLLKTRS